MQKPDTRQTTTYLKGIAIMGVVVGHTLDYYVRGASSWIEGIDNGMVAIFFVLSGFGIYHSLSRRLDGGFSWKALGNFYATRAWRIYPIFWLTLLVTPYFIKPYAAWHDPGLSLGIKYLGFGGFLGAYTRPNEFTWFVYALIPCYVAAPLLFALLRRIGAKWHLILCAAAAIGSLGISLLLLHNLSALPDQAFAFRRFVLANLLLFSMGMAIAPLLPRLEQRLAGAAVRYGAVLASIIIFVVLLGYSRVPDILFRDSETMLGPAFILASVLLCLAVLAARPALPLRQPVNFLGRHSYPIYLLHLPFWGLLGIWGIVTPGSVSLDGPPGSISLTLLLLPAFLLICLGLDRLQSLAGARFAAWLRSRREAACEAAPEAGTMPGESTL